MLFLLKIITKQQASHSSLVKLWFLSKYSHSQVVMTMRWAILSWVSYWMHLLCRHIIYWLKKINYWLEMSLGTLSVCIVALVFIFTSRLRFASSSSIVEMLHNRYCNDLVKNVRKLEKIDYKYHKLHLDLNFLQTCQYSNVFQSLCNLSYKLTIFFSLQHLPKNTVKRRNQYKED